MVKYYPIPKDWKKYLKELENSLGLKIVSIRDTDCLISLGLYLMIFNSSSWINWTSPKSEEQMIVIWVIHGLPKRILFFKSRSIIVNSIEIILPSKVKGTTTWPRGIFWFLS